MKSKYYNGADLLNADCPINFSIGNRSAGKSYYWKRYCIKRFINNDERFIYLRRYDSDMQDCLPHWFDDIGNEFPGYEMEVKNNVFYLCKGEDRKICGYAFALTILHKLKSIPFESVVTIFYDEFIPENMQYIKPSNPMYEPSLLLSLYLTVARGYKRVIRDEVKIICVANMVSKYNPYFSYFGVNFKNKNKIKDNNVYGEIYFGEEVAQEIRESKIGAILEKTKYGDYALSNISQYDNDASVMKKPKDARPLFSLYFNRWYTAWVDNDGNIYFTDTYDSTLKRKFKIVDIEELNGVPWFTGDVIKMLKKVASQGKVYYDNQEIKANISGFIIPKF